MKTFHKKIAAATVLCVAGGAWAGITSGQPNSDLPAIRVGANADATFVSALHGIDRPDTLATIPAVSPMYVAAANPHSQLPLDRSDDVTVVPLPPAAPAGIMTLALMGLVGFIRRMRNRIGATA